MLLYFWFKYELDFKDLWRKVVGFWLLLWLFSTNSIDTLYAVI